MLSKEAWAKAADCAARAEETIDEQMRILFIRLRDSWIRVANNCESVEGATAARPLATADDS
jgi:hypothetical protein